MQEQARALVEETRRRQLQRDKFKRDGDECEKQVREHYEDLCQTIAREDVHMTELDKETPVNQLLIRTAYVTNLFVYQDKIELNSTEFQRFRNGKKTIYEESNVLPLPQETKEESEPPAFMDNNVYTFTSQVDKVVKRIAQETNQANELYNTCIRDWEAAEKQYKQCLDLEVSIRRRVEEIKTALFEWAWNASSDSDGYDPTQKTLSEQYQQKLVEYRANLSRLVTSRTLLQTIENLPPSVIQFFSNDAEGTQKLNSIIELAKLPLSKEAQYNMNQMELDYKRWLDRSLTDKDFLFIKKALEMVERIPENNEDAFNTHIKQSNTFLTRLKLTENKELRGLLEKLLYEKEMRVAALEKIKRAKEEKARREKEEDARRKKEENAKREEEEKARREEEENARREEEENARRVEEELHDVMIDIPLGSGLGLGLDSDLDSDLASNQISPSP
jgi:hypothetical protein